jgi:large subunit ribosomal protein L9
MSKKVSVILLEDIKELGSAGQIKLVSEGYARNFLFPEGKAALADEQAQAAAKKQASTQRDTDEQALVALRAQAAALDSTELTMTAHLKEGDEIFGSITARHIATALHEQAHLKFSARDILLKRPITRLGSEQVTVRLASDVEAVIRVTLIPDEEK